MTALGFFRQTKKMPASKTRQLLRERVRTNGLLIHKHLRYSASLVDINEEGTQVRTRAKIQKGDLITLDAPENNIDQRQGEVRWIQRSFGYTNAGVFFQRETE